MDNHLKEKRTEGCKFLQKEVRQVKFKVFYEPKKKKIAAGDLFLVHPTPPSPFEF
jgi:hypothetical protein